MGNQCCEHNARAHECGLHYQFSIYIHIRIHMSSENERIISCTLKGILPKRRVRNVY